MEGMFAVFMVFGMPVFIVAVLQYFKAVREGKMGPLVKANLKELDTVREERKRLEERVQNLESIVCSVDFELNQRLNKLLVQKSATFDQPPAALVASASPASPAEGPGGTLGAAATSPTLSAPRHGAGPLQPGQKVADRYTVVRELGRGAMGMVYLASDEKLGERVALKVVSPLLAGDPDVAAERFRREVAAARKVTHRNVIRIHDLVEDGGLLLLSMEYVAGQTLAALLGRGGLLSIEEGRSIVGQICDGLGAAHAAGVIHRDLKPANVLLDGEKQVKIIDFGIARASYLAGMTATGLILGTPEYMAPEQVRGLPCDGRTDLYALGALAYHVFAGRPPFSGDTPIAIGYKQVSESPRAPRELRPELPSAIEAALLRALSKDPAARFTDATELRQALGR